MTAPEETVTVNPQSVTPPSEQELTAAGTECAFVRVCRAGQVPDGYVRRFYVDELECAIARLGGKAYATSNYCTHLDCLLSSGKLIDDGIKCSCHGSVFDLETGDPIYPPASVPIQVYPVREADGEIHVGVTAADVASGGPRRRQLRRD
jgi:3-phenylpropionate/trans-cinnamate dioxygenase ferredoxin subunit